MASGMKLATDGEMVGYTSSLLLKSFSIFSMLMLGTFVCKE